MKFFIVDAFTDTLFGGNPAGVVIVDEGKDFPAEEVMLKTAAELRYSETAFIKKTGEGVFHTRYFTPEAEVELCGHATIGTFYALLYAGVIGKNTVYKNKTLAGVLNIEVPADFILMDMAAPEAIGKIEEEKAMSEIYGVMGLTNEERHRRGSYGGKTAVLMPEIISTGLPDILMPVADEAALTSIRPDFPALSALSERYKVVGVHAFTLNAGDGKVHCRNFAPLYAIDEEAATGTSNGALTYYLYKNGLIKEGAETVFIQGEAMNRPSKIISRLSGTAPDVQVRIGGSAIVLAEGEIHL